ncbi:hypothetical protein [Clostridium sp. KNHs214]|uniref:hypothetical protein n=1 Tax=Clostridium sp. KNHs214 TaxID=1540257 RepID=UPI000A645DFF|nr:hypothetical protein [Clostridium sp. KNHs214]
MLATLDRIYNAFNSAQEVALMLFSQNGKYHVVIPPNEKMGVMMAYDYKIIFEKQTTTE